MKMGGNADRLLSRRRVRNEQDLLRFQEFLQLFDFLDERRVDFLSARGIENLDVAALFRGPIKARGRRAAHIFFLRIRSVNRDLDLPAERGQLLDRRRPLQIAGDEERRASLLLEIPGQLGGRRRFSSAVQSHYQNARRFFQIQRRGVTAQQRRQFVMKNFNNLLPGRDTSEHFFAERLLLDAGDELLRDLEIDVGFEQGKAHLAQSIVNVRFADRAVTAKVLEDVLKLVAELRKHGALNPGSARASRAGFGASPKQSCALSSGFETEKVRDREGAIASTRGACAPQTITPPRACAHAAAGAVPARRTPARKACETSPSLRCRDRSPASAPHPCIRIFLDLP